MGTVCVWLNVFFFFFHLIYLTNFLNAFLQVWTQDWNLLYFKLLKHKGASQKLFCWNKQIKCFFGGPMYIQEKEKKTR